MLDRARRRFAARSGCVEATGRPSWEEVSKIKELPSCQEGRPRFADGVVFLKSHGLSCTYTLPPPVTAEPVPPLLGRRGVRSGNSAPPSLWRGRAYVVSSSGTLWPGHFILLLRRSGILKTSRCAAFETLRAVDVIACEDTRHTRKLLNHYEISNSLVSYHEHNEEARSAELVERLRNGESAAIVSDAGTPGINDPGFVVVQKAIAAGIDVVPIPGPVAFVSAVTASGIATDSIFFGGFLPSKSGDRRKRLAELAAVPRDSRLLRVAQSAREIARRLPRRSRQSKLPHTHAS